MCGIAGIIYRDGGGERHVGRDMTAMLQAMKHRGPDSTGYALYRPASEGRLTSTTRPVHRGRSQQVWVVETTDEQGRLVARGQVRLQNLRR